MIEKDGAFDNLKRYSSKMSLLKIKNLKKTWLKKMGPSWIWKTYSCKQIYKNKKLETQIQSHQNPTLHKNKWNTNLHKQNKTKLKEIDSHLSIYIPSYLGLVVGGHRRKEGLNDRLSKFGLW
jgi:hypothetical protein